MTRFALPTVLVSLALLGPVGRALEPITVSARARAQEPGELVVLTMTMADASHAPRIPAFDRVLLPFGSGPNTWQVLVGIDLETTPGTYPVKIEAATGAATTTYSLVVKPKTFPT